MVRLCWLPRFVWVSGVNGLPSGQARGGASPLAPRQAARGPPSKPPDQGAGGRANFWKKPFRAVALHAAQRIQARDVTFAPVRQFELRDRGKVRQICEESADQQVFEYIAQYALTPLFRAKILPCQYGSIPGKGQVCGKRKLERILRHQLHGKTDAVKCDIKKATPPPAWRW